MGKLAKVFFVLALIGLGIGAMNNVHAQSKKKQIQLLKDEINKLKSELDELKNSSDQENTPKRVDKITGCFYLSTTTLKNEIGKGNPKIDTTSTITEVIITIAGKDLTEKLTIPTFRGEAPAHCEMKNIVCVDVSEFEKAVNWSAVIKFMNMNDPTEYSLSVGNVHKIKPTEACQRIKVY